MHIPDGLMWPPLLAIGFMVAALFIGISVHGTNKRLEDRQVPLMALLAAWIFVAQMLDIPVLYGTSVHVIGAAMVAILLGPLVGILVITTVLVIQCLLFGDGGITALGLNILNLGIITSLVGYYVYMPFERFSKNIRLVGVFTATSLSVLAAATACALQLGISASMSAVHGIPLNIALPWMLFYHSILAPIEAMVTVFAITIVAQARPDLLEIPRITLGNAFQRVVT